jgi:putative FmdB family regulatory protein
MPIYDYGCEKCGHKYEKLVKLNAENPPCPECESTDIKKLVSPSGFLLKGSGWYRDHYGLKPSGDGGGSSSGGDSSSGGGNSGSGGEG